MSGIPQGNEEFHEADEHYRLYEELDPVAQLPIFQEVRLGLQPLYTLPAEIPGEPMLPPRPALPPVSPPKIMPQLPQIHPLPSEIQGVPSAQPRAPILPLPPQEQPASTSQSTAISTALNIPDNLDDLPEEPLATLHLQGNLRKYSSKQLAFMQANLDRNFDDILFNSLRATHGHEGI